MAEPAARSTFVTVVAWIFIVLSGFAVLSAIMQNVMVFVLFPHAGLEQEFQTESAAGMLPGFAQFMLSNLEWIVPGLLAVALLAFVSAIGLLKRKEWARQMFIALLSLSVLWNIGMFILQQLVISEFVAPSDVPPDVSVDFAAMAIVMRVFAGVVTLLVTILLGWLAWRFMSRRIRAEFHGF